MTIALFNLALSSLILELFFFLGYLLISMAILVVYKTQFGDCCPTVIPSSLELPDAVGLLSQLAEGPTAHSVCRGGGDGRSETRVEKPKGCGWDCRTAHELSEGSCAGLQGSVAEPSKQTAGVSGSWGEPWPSCRTL